MGHSDDPPYYTEARFRLRVRLRTGLRYYAAHWHAPRFHRIWGNDVVRAGTHSTVGPTQSVGRIPRRPAGPGACDGTRNCQKRETASALSTCSGSLSPSSSGPAAMGFAPPGAKADAASR